MKNFPILVSKEFKHLWRNKETFFTLIVFPILMVPLILGFVYLLVSVMKHEVKKDVHLGIIGQANAPELYYILRSNAQFVLHHDITKENIETLIDDGVLHAAIVIPDDFQTNIQAMKETSITLYIKTSGPKSMGLKNIQKVLDMFTKAKAEQRLKRLNLDDALLTVVTIDKKDLASKTEQIGKKLGIMIPFLFLFECFVISLSVAIEIGIGEKERGTLETLLTMPVSKVEILWSKFSLVFLAGVWASGISIFMIVLLFVTEPSFIPSKIIHIVSPVLQPIIVLQVYILLIPLAAFFAAMLLAISLAAKTVSQASMLSTLPMLLIYPLFIGLTTFPIKLDMVTALVPVMNVMLACREVAAGTLGLPHLLMVVVSSCLLAALTIFVCSKVMLKEKTIFSE